MPRRTPSSAARRRAQPADGSAHRPCEAGSPRSRTGRRAVRRPPARSAPPRGPAPPSPAPRPRSPPPRSGSRDPTPRASRHRWRPPPSRRRASRRPARVSVRPRCPRSRTPPARRWSPPAAPAASAAGGCPRPRSGPHRSAPRSSRGSRRRSRRSACRPAPTVPTASSSLVARCVPWTQVYSHLHLHTLSRVSVLAPPEDVASPEGADAPPPPPRPPSTLERLRVPPLTDRLAGWLVTLAVTAIAFVLRRRASRSPERADLRRDLLRQGRVLAAAVRLRALLARRRQRQDPGRQPGRDEQRLVVHRAPPARQVADRGR